VALREELHRVAAARDAASVEADKCRTLLTTALIDLSRAQDGERHAREEAAARSVNTASSAEKLAAAQAALAEAAAGQAAAQAEVAAVRLAAASSLAACERAVTTAEREALRRVEAELDATTARAEERVAEAGRRADAAVSELGVRQAQVARLAEACSEYAGGLARAALAAGLAEASATPPDPNRAAELRQFISRLVHAVEGGRGGRGHEEGSVSTGERASSASSIRGALLAFGAPLDAGREGSWGQGERRGSGGVRRGAGLPG
jgi:hypothetical protein